MAGSLNKLLVACSVSGWFPNNLFVAYFVSSLFY